MQTSFGPGESSGLASVVIVVRMTVTPIPIRPLISLFHFRKRTILSVSFTQVHAKGTVFVVIPVVIVPVITVIDAVAVIVVTTVFFLSSVVLRLACCVHYRWRSQGCCKNEKTEQILMATLHVVFLLAQDFLIGILGLRGVCSARPVSDVRFRTLLSLFRVHTHQEQTLLLNGVLRSRVLTGSGSSRPPVFHHVEGSVRGV
jgi:hypothetical protein